MKRSWLVLLAVIVLGGLTGIAIAGRPTSVDTLVVSAPSTPDDTGPVVSAVATTVSSTPVSSTTVSSTSSVASTSTTEPPLDPTTMRVLVANASNRPGIAGTTADLLIGLGYLAAEAVDARDSADTTSVYFRPGFEAQAAAVAADLNLSSDRVQALPAQAITDDDTRGDVIVVIGRTT